MKYLDQYVEYINNTGGSPTVEQFDEDWEPIGPMLRRDMLVAGLITEDNGVIRLEGVR